MCVWGTNLHYTIFLAPLMTHCLEVGQTLQQKDPDQITGGVRSRAGGGLTFTDRCLKLHLRSLSLLLTNGLSPALLLSYYQVARKKHLKTLNKFFRLWPEKYFIPNDYKCLT